MRLVIWRQFAYGAMGCSWAKEGTVSLRIVPCWSSFLWHDLHLCWCHCVNPTAHQETSSANSILTRLWKFVRFIVIYTQVNLVPWSMREKDLRIHTHTRTACLPEELEDNHSHLAGFRWYRHFHLLFHKRRCEGAIAPKMSIDPIRTGPARARWAGLYKTSWRTWSMCRSDSNHLHL